jgi:hypothetical protein
MAAVLLVVPSPAQASHRAPHEADELSTPVWRRRRRYPRPARSRGFAATEHDDEEQEDGEDDGDAGRKRSSALITLIPINPRHVSGLAEDMAGRLVLRTANAPAPLARQAADRQHRADGEIRRRSP